MKKDIFCKIFSFLEMNPNIFRIANYPLFLDLFSL
jgi:hypothetical protein